MRFAHLPSRSVIRVTGPEAKGFLQSLVSNDMEKVWPGEAIFAALLSPQGKLLYDFIVSSDRADGYLLDVEAERADEFFKKLKLYKLRAKVTLELTSYAVHANFPVESEFEGNATDTFVVRDPRLKDLGQRLYSLSKLGPKAETNDIEYAKFRISLGLPEGTSEFGFEKLFLLEANLEELHGVDFKKGCYIGQELTSRMKRKAELKKRLLPFRIAPLPEPGTPLTSEGREIGSVIGGRFDTAFVLVRLDRLAAASPASLKLGDTQATQVRPAYLTELA